MPLTGPASYLPTADDFISHWTTANAAMPPTTPIVLAAAATVTTLSTLRADLETQRAAVESSRNGVELARAQIETLKADLLERLNQFNLKLASLAPDSPFMRLRPKAFTQGEGMGRVLPPLDDLADVWERYNTAFTTAPLLLMNGYTYVDFTSDLDSLKLAYPAWSAAKNALALARAKRTETENKIRAILVQYRQRIPSEFPEGSPILETLPRLTPPDGATPDAVVLSGTWNPATTQADLAWSEVTDESVTTLQLRASAGPEYDAEDESVVATFPAGTTPPAWSGLWGLAAPGTATTFKLYSITAEGNEHGSNAVTVTRTA